jgi:hypothetical protein
LRCPKIQGTKEVVFSGVRDRDWMEILNARIDLSDISASDVIVFYISWRREIQTQKKIRNFWSITEDLRDDIGKIMAHAREE